mgnify:CR=1 FL=1
MKRVSAAASAAAAAAAAAATSGVTSGASASAFANSIIFLTLSFACNLYISFIYLITISNLNTFCNQEVTR